MVRYIVRRLLALVGVLLLICAITFVIFYVFPANPANQICGKGCTPSRIATINHTLGLDQPLAMQFLNYVKGIFAGRSFGTAPNVIHCGFPCLGFSFQNNENVWSLLMNRLSVSASIAAGAAVLWLVSGVLIGTISAVRPRSVVDRGLMALSLLGMATPSFLTGIVLLYAFATKLNVLPYPTYVPFLSNPLLWARGLILPWITLAVANAAYYARYTRGSMSETLSQDYIRTAEAKGAAPARVIGKHGMRAGLTPIVTIFGLDIGALLGGTVIIETLFGLPGLGQLFIQSVNKVDIPVVLGVTVLAAFFVVFANLVVDVLYAVLDPRVRLG